MRNDHCTKKIRTLSRVNKFAEDDVDVISLRMYLVT